KVKDVLDIFVRRGAAQPQELSPQMEPLRKIADTRGVLGLVEPRSSVQSETERLRKIVEGTLKADESTLVEIAAALIGVEDKLDDSLVGMILPKDAQLPRAAEDTEFQQVQAAVLRECIVNLARIKDAITQRVGGTLAAGGALGSLVHAGQRPGVRAGPRAAADPGSADGRAARIRRPGAYRADTQPLATARQAAGRGSRGRRGPDARALEEGSGTGRAR